jgi:hypothetical protein
MPKRISMIIRREINRTMRQLAYPIRMINSLSRPVKVISGIVAIAVGAVSLMTTHLNWTADRALISIPHVAFTPVRFEADQRVRVEFVLRNSGKIAAEIEEIATDRFDEDSANKRYGFTKFAPFEIAPGGQARVISDTGARPLTFGRVEFDNLWRRGTEFKVVGFVRYADAATFAFGRTVVGFCFVWDPNDTPSGNFSKCAEPSYTFRRHYFFGDGLQRRMVTPGGGMVVQTVSSTSLTLQVRDPRFPEYELEIRH